MIVLDASAGVALLINDVDLATPVARRLESEQVHAPEVFDLEVLQALRGLRRGGKRSLDEMAADITALESLAIDRWPHLPFDSRIWQLRDNLTAYDAAYVALAETLDVPLVTLDAKLASAAPPSARVEVIEASLGGSRRI